MSCIPHFYPKDEELLITAAIFVLCIDQPLANWMPERLYSSSNYTLRQKFGSLERRVPVSAQLTDSHTPREWLRAQPQHEPAGAGSGVASARTNRRDAALHGSGLRLPRAPHRRSPAGTCCCGRCSGRTAPAPGKSSAGRASGGSAAAAPPRPPPPRRPRPPPPRRRRWGSCRRRTVRGAHGRTSRTCA